MDCKEILIESGKRMLNSGLTVETWGNLSVRDPETGYIYLTPSGMPYHTIGRDDIVVMDKNGNRVEGNRAPTIEWAMHLGIMNSRPDVGAIIHTHPLYSQIFGLLHEPIPPVIDEAAQTMNGTVEVAKYAIPGSEELAENVVEALGEKAACLMANHGAVCVGKDMDAAFRTSEVLEMTARILYMAKCIGEPKPVPPEKIPEMLAFIKEHYGQR